MTYDNCSLNVIYKGDVMTIQESPKANSWQSTMTSFISNKLPSAETATAVYNLATALLVSYNYVTDSEAKSIEYIPDIAVHALSAWTFSNLNVFKETDDEDLILSSMAFLNVSRIVEIALALDFRVSSIPTMINLVDLGNHSWNIWGLLFWSEKSKSS